MSEYIPFLVTIICAIFASSGFWAFVQKKMDKKDSKTQLLLGIAHDRILYLGMQYLSREPAYITEDEYENLVNRLFVPYEQCGGNGTAKKVVEEVKKIPIHERRLNGGKN